MLPPLADGEHALLSEPRVEGKRTQAPPRYNEGTLIDAMQNAWRFVEDPVQRERLKDAKGVGTPATRAAIIEGLKRQGLLAPSGKWIVPTEAGLELYALLSEAAPVLADPGTTALWELKLDGIQQRASGVLQVVDEIAAEAGRLIEVLKQYSGRAIALVPGSARATGLKKQSSVRRRVRKAAGRKPGKRGMVQGSAGGASPETRAGSPGGKLQRACTDGEDDQLRPEPRAGAEGRSPRGRGDRLSGVQGLSRRTHADPRSRKLRATVPSIQQTQSFQQPTGFRG